MLRSVELLPAVVLRFDLLRPEVLRRPELLRSAELLRRSLVRLLPIVLWLRLWLPGPVRRPEEALRLPEVLLP